MRNKEWKKYKLSNITSKLGDGLHGTPKYDNNGEYYFINGNNLENGKIVIKPDTKRVSFTEYQKYKKELNNNTILLSINGTLGNIGYYNNEKVILGKSACYFNLKDGFSKDYVRYIMSTKSFKLFLENFATGATIKNVSLDAMRNFEFYAPRKDLQDKIAKILSNYDNLIENNNKRIKILEEMAQKIYKEWFVDFKFPGHETATFKDSPLGKIPKDWEVLKANNVADIFIGRTPSRKDFDCFTMNCKDRKWISIKDIGLSNVFIFQTSEYLTEDAIIKYNVPIIPKDTVILSFKLTVGKVAITTEDMCSNEAIAQFQIKDKQQLSTYYLYLYLKNFEYSNLGNTSSIGNAINSTIVKNMNILIPQRSILSEFNKSINSIFEQIKNLSIKNENLKQTRDILLPRLISGEIDVENMEVL